MNGPWSRKTPCDTTIAASHASSDCEFSREYVSHPHANLLARISFFMAHGRRLRAVHIRISCMARGLYALFVLLSLLLMTAALGDLEKLVTRAQQRQIWVTYPGAVLFTMGRKTQTDFAYPISITRPTLLRPAAAAT